MKGKIILLAAAVFMLILAGCQTAGSATAGNNANAVDGLNYFNPEKVPITAANLGDGNVRVQSTQGMRNVNSFMTFWNTLIEPVAPQFRNGYVISVTLPDDPLLQVVRLQSYADTVDPGNFGGTEISIGDPDNGDSDWWITATDVLAPGEYILRWEGSTRLNLARIILRIDYISGTEIGKDFDFKVNYVRATR